MSLYTARLASLATLVSMSALTAFSAVNAQQVFPTADKAVKPAADSFYTPPSDAALAAAKPGTVLRYRALPASALWTDVKEGWQIMYRSSGQKSQPVAMVTTFFVPKTVSATGKKLVSYQSFYDSLTLNCSPSGSLLRNVLFDKTFFKTALSKGYYTVVADYEGLDSQWIAALNTGHGVLDSIRAVQNFSADLDEKTPVGMYGFSGGGFASIWGAELASTYAPELNIVGVAAGGLPANPINVAKKVDGTLFAGAYIGAIVGLSRAYPEIDVVKYGNEAGVAALADAGTRCLGGTLSGNPELLTAFAFKKGSAYYKDPNFLELPEMQAINKENTMGQSAPKFPTYIWLGTTDELMPMADTEAVVNAYCAAGTPVQFKKLFGVDHVVGATYLGGALTYLIDRFNGKPAPNTCK